MRHYEWPRKKLRKDECEEGVKKGLRMKVGDCNGSGMGMGAC